MARLNNGFLGNASGKIGNVVFAKWRKIFTARQYQPEIKDANSPEQQKQRNKMIALLQFLKPLNKSFITSFNAPSCVNSTPWSKAIKDNMPVVSPEGCILLKDFILGDPRLPQLNIIGASYDPFIDQIQLSYQMPVIPEENNNFPYFGISALGKYKSSDDTPSLDIRHLMCCHPKGSWYCFLSDNMEQSFYLNYWEEGRIWLIIDENNIYKHKPNPFQNIYATAYFEAVPLIGCFNKNVKVNLVPVNALTWEYLQGSNDWYIKFHIDFSKTSLTSPADYTLKLWTVTLSNGNHVISGPYEWDLQECQFEVILGQSGLTGSVICLYSIFNKQNVQVSRFNRFYISNGSNGVVYPYFQQMFDCNYSHPVSFQLSGNQCGFCGSIDEIFSEFIDLWEQGIITPNENPLPPTPPVEYSLTFNQGTYGTVNITGYTRVVDNIYYFNEGQRALLEIVPNQGYVFNTWSGADSGDLINIDNKHYSILMSKNRVLGAAFITDPNIFYVLIRRPYSNGHFDITGYDHKVDENYYFLPGQIARIAITPDAGFVFSNWLGTAGYSVVMDGTNEGHIVMNSNYDLQAIFITG